jgi:hypothetical protein
MEGGKTPITSALGRSSNGFTANSGEETSRWRAMPVDMREYKQCHFNFDRCGYGAL